MAFHSLGLNPEILRSIQDAGYHAPTPIQSKAIPCVLSGSDVIGIAQTGTGKTAAFTLPILHQLSRRPRVGPPGGPSSGPRALILAPTRELAAQIEDNVKIYGRHLRVRVATIFGGVGESAQIRALQEGVEIIIATPGRLIDLMGQGYGRFQSLEFLVLDEADRMLDMGFLPAIRRIVRALPPKRQTLLFSATLSKEIEAIAREFLRFPKVVEVGRRANPAETVSQMVYEIPAHQKASLLIQLLREPGFQSVLVFTRTKRGADRICRTLHQAQIDAQALHSDRSQSQRKRALSAFKAGETRVLVATDIAARGIDVDGISHVVNYDFPMHPEDYVHRIGRTGRAAADGDAITFVTAEDRGALRSLERFIGRSIPRKQVALQERMVAAPGMNTGGAPTGLRRGPRGGGTPRSAERGSPKQGSARSFDPTRPQPRTQNSGFRSHRRWRR